MSATTGGAVTAGSTDAAASGAEPSTHGHRRLTYQPAFDGIRGIGLLFVMAYHFGYERSWASGAFFWVSTFFTLSGFLITSLLIVEQHTTGRVSLSAFWSRRFRRLMPGAVVTLAGVILFGVFVADASQLSQLRADGIAALLYVANWRFIVADQTYAGLFASPSPVQHFWTLSIEEQFYIFFPLLLAGALVWGRRSWTRVGWMVAGLTAAASVWGVWLYTNGAPVDRIYFGTDTRLPELTLGVLLAIVVARWRPEDRPRATRVLHVAAVPAIAAVLLATVFVGRTDSWLYYGGLPAYGVLSCVLIVSVFVPGGLVRRALSWRPLRWVGALSYGGYLFHWPLFLTFTPTRVGFDGPALFVALVVLTLALAWASNRFIEHPIRVGKRITAHQARVVVPASFAVIIVGFVLVTANPPAPAVDLGADGSGSDWRDMPAPIEGVPRVLIVGDSQAYVLGRAVERWGDATGAAVVWSNALAGCGIVRGGEANLLGEIRESPCDDWEQRWSAALDAFDPDVVMVLSAGWDWIDRRLDTWDGWRSYGDPEFDAHLVAEYGAAADLLASNGARIAWLNSACYELEDFGQHPGHLNEDLIASMAASRSESVSVIDFHGEICPDGVFTRRLYGLDDARPDGAHLSEPAADRVADWLGPQLVALAAEGRHTPNPD